MSLGGVSCDLQEGLCHTQFCCTQSPCLCSRPLLTQCTSAGGTQTLKGKSDSVSVGSPGVHKVLFEPSECLWQVWGLILNVISPLLPSCWGFSFALGHEISPQSHSSAAQPLLQHLLSCWGFSVLGPGVSPHSCSSATQSMLQCRSHEIKRRFLLGRNVMTNLNSFLKIKKQRCYFANESPSSQSYSFSSSHV